MEIELEEDCYNKLVDHVPQGSSAFAALKNAAVTGNGRLIVCFQQDIDVFLETAKKHFPFQVREIEFAYTHRLR